MNGFYILLTGGTLLLTGIFLLRREKPRKSFLFRQKNRKTLPFTRTREYIIVGYDQNQLRMELENTLDNFRQTTPSIHVRLVHGKPQHLVHKLDQRHMDLILSKADSPQAMETEPAPFSAAISEALDSRFFKETCTANPSFSGMLYLLWNEKHVSEGTRDLINFLTYDAVTLHTGYCDYRTP